MENLLYLPHAQMDLQRWDDSISRAINGNVYAYSWYLNRVSPNWDALITPDYEIVMPLTWRKKWGIKYLYNPLFIQQLGVYHRHRMPPGGLVPFLEKCRQLVSYADVHFNQYNSIPNDAPGTFQLRINTELDLIPDYTLLEAAYNQNTRRNLRKANDNNLSVTTHIGVSDIIDLFAANRGKDVAYDRVAYRVLRELCAALAERRSLFLLGVNNEVGKPIAGAIFASSHQKIVFLFSGLTTEGKEKGAMFLLLDHLIRSNSQHNLTLDFEGSNDPGIAQFYKGFGGKQIHYPAWHWNGLPVPLRWLKKS